MYRSHLGFTSVIVTVLALGVGATSAIFSLADGVVMHPLPYEDPDRLVAVWETRPDMNSVPASPATFLDLRAQSESFSGLTAYSGRSFNVTSWNEPERIEGAIVPPDFFDLFDMRAEAGTASAAGMRDFAGARPVLISDKLWRTRFAGSPNAVGATLGVDGQAFAVAGVMPAEFQFPQRADLWVIANREFPDPPIRTEADLAKSRELRYLGLVGRLRKSASLRSAQAELDVIGRRWERESPESNTGYRLRINPLLDEIAGNVRPAFRAMLGAVFSLLLIACFNIANLLLGRALARRREFSLRLALGASGGRLLRQLLVEHLALALMAGAAGLLLANFGIRLLVAVSPADLPRLNQVSLNGRVVLVTLATSILATVILGLAPMLQALKTDVRESFQEVSRGSSEGRGSRLARRALVIAEVALSFVLLACAGLMLRSFAQIRSLPLGFDAHNVWTMQISLPRLKYTSPAQVAGFYTDVLERVSHLPGVTAAGAISKLPLTGPGLRTQFTLYGRTAAPGQDSIADLRMVSPDYFRAMAIPLRLGRWIEPADASGPAVAIVNEAAAKKFWPGENPVGKRINLGGEPDSWVEVKGVAGDVRYSDLVADPRPELYVPYPQRPWNNMTLVVRLKSNMASITSAVRRQVFEVDKTQPVFNQKPLDQVIDESCAVPRFSMVILGILAALSLTLAAVGLYGVMSAALAQRTREIGIRMALGLAPAGVMRLIALEGLALAIGGLAIGLGLAAALSQGLSNLFYKVSSLDPVTYSVIVAVQLCVMLGAALGVAWRAAHIDPVEAIRFEGQ